MWSLNPYRDMTQIIESRFRVLGIDEDDVLLNDIVDTYLPVFVNKEREGYNKDLQTKIRGLEPGNVVEAEIQSESITQQDDTWKFLELVIKDRTRFHFIEEADNHSSHIEDLAQKAERTNNDAARTTISSHGDKIGFVTVSKDKGSEFWSGLKMGTNTHEVDISNLEGIDDPPYEVIYTRTSNEDQLIFYHFAEKGTEIAEAILSANQNE